MNQHVLLKGIVGSTAYGLAHEGSDVDYLGVYAAPTKALLGLHPPKDTQVSKDPDTTLHEARKFIGLCLGGNPTVFELLWLEKYSEITRLGQHLISIRESFLGAHRVRDAYLGYAVQQFEWLNRENRFPNVPDPRIEKHARHLVRLVQQGLELYKTGRLTIRLDNPEHVREMGVRIAADPMVGSELVEKARNDFSGDSPALPERASEEEAEFWLHRVRTEFWRP